MNKRDEFQALGKWSTLGFIFLFSLITYLDRVNIAIAGESLAREYGFGRVRLGVIFSAFALGYGLFQVPGGYLGDRFGHKKVLTLALVWWSVFTSLTAAVGDSFVVALVGVVPAYCLVRFLIGAGEAATYPCCAGLIRRRFPPNERGLAFGIMVAGVGLGSAITPPVVAWLMLRWGWRSAFYFSGAIGIALAVWFHLRITEPSSEGYASSGDKPQTVRAGEQLSCVKGTRASGTKNSQHWKEMLENRDVWMLTISDFLNAYIGYLYLFWFYIYLVNIRGFSVLSGSFFAALPFLAMAIGSPLGGWLSDRLSFKMGRGSALRLVAVNGLILAALLIFFGAGVENAYVAVVFLAIAAGALYLTVGCYWAKAIEIVPSRSATVSAIMNTGGNLGGAVSAILTPWVAGRYGWVIALRLAAAFGLLAAIFWMLVRTSENATRSN
jgi:ACS family glucarate transporter-like MFS transporter